MARRDDGNEIVRRVDDLVDNFDSYLSTFTKENPFTADQLRPHVDTIALRKRLGTVSAALGDEGFVKNLYLTLDSWDMNSHGAKLVRIDCFTKALQTRPPWWRGDFDCEPALEDHRRPQHR